jgi:acyl-CoA synthetase (AMP-forming)/AMP-acid ligase II
MTVPEMTVGAVLAHHVRERGDHPWIVCDDDRLTYADADRESRAIARGLIAAGIGRSAHVGILYPTSVEYVCTWLAVVRLGAVAVPISTFSTADELATLIRNADLRAIVTTREYRGNDYVAALQRAFPDLDATSAEPCFLGAAPHLRRVVVTEDLARLGPDAAHIPDDWVDRLEADVTPSDRMVIVHTSGSTSAPKGVIHQHGPLLRHLHNLNGVRGMTADTRLFSNSPLFWIGGLGYNVVGTLVAGATLICSRAEDPRRTLDLIERERPDMVNGFAQSVAALVQDPSFAARDFSFIRTGNLYPIMPAALQPADAELRHNMLGLTELGSVALMSPDESDQPERYRGSFGKPVPEVEARIADFDTGEAAAPGEDGELWFRGPLLMEGYYGRERHDVFTPDEWFRTGDVFSVDDDGFFYFRGRRGDMIKTAGANVSPREVEGVLRELTGCVLAIVLGLPDAARDQIVAAVVVDATTTLDDDALHAALRERLSAYKVPRRILRLRMAEVPMLSSGKPDMPRVVECFDVA